MKDHITAYQRTHFTLLEKIKYFFRNKKFIL